MFGELPSVVSGSRPQQHIWAILRIFDEPNHRDQFLSGKVRFNTLGHYRDREALGNRLRGDQWEGVASYVDSEGVTLTISGKEVGGLTGPILYHPPNVNSWNVCSFVALHWPADQPFDALDAPEVLERIRLGSELRGFGEHLAVVADGNGFLNAVKKAAEVQGFRIRAGLVDYFDQDAGMGSVPPERLGFVKRGSPYAHQREFRIVIPRRNPDEELLWLELEGEGPTWGHATTFDEFNSKGALRER